MGAGFVVVLDNADYVLFAILTLQPVDSTLEVALLIAVATVLFKPLRRCTDEILDATNGVFPVLLWPPLTH
ncbi:hypothetical protein VRRI112168_20065 [Vreelandella rituensis]